MWGMSIMHWAVVLILVLMLFGRNKVSTVMKDLGGGLREFKKGMSEATGNSEEIEAIPDFSETKQPQESR